MNGELYKAYLHEYNEYANSTNEPADCDAWIMLRWMARCCLDAQSKQQTYHELMLQLLRDGEDDLYDAIERGWQIARQAMMEKRDR